MAVKTWKILLSMTWLLTAVTLLLALTVNVRAESIRVLDANNRLLRIDSANPAGLLGAPLTITGMAAGDSMFAIDFRPLDGVLVGLGYNSGAGTGRVYSINTTSGAATQIQPVNLALGFGLTQFGFDFNPSVNALRITAANLNNTRITSGGTGSVISDTGINPAGNNLAGLAYSNNVAGAGSTTLFGAEANAANLVTINTPNNGTVSLVGSLGVTGSRISGFDISGATGTAFLSIVPAAPGDTQSRLFTVNLASGAATEVVGATDGTGRIGGGLTVRDVSVVVAATLAADYNNNGTVDAADYVLWRNGGPLANEVDTPGVVNAADYTAWRARFGNTSGSGAGAGAAVPEPGMVGLAGLSLLGWIAVRIRS